MRRAATGILHALGRPVVAGALAAVLTRAPQLWDRTLVDVDVYATIGQQWWHGVAPYRDIFDHKGPFLYELFAVLTAVLPRSLFALHVALLAAFLVSIWQLGALAGRYAGRTAAVCAAVVYAVAASSVVFEGPEPNAEQWALIGLVACVDLADRFRAGGRLAHAVGAGIVLAAIVAIKPGHLVMAPIVVVLLALRRDRRAAGLAAAGGAFVVTGLAILVPIALSGALGEMRFAVIDYNRTYAGNTFDALLDGGPGLIRSWLLTFPGSWLLFAGMAGALVTRGSPDARRLITLAAVWAVAAWVFARSSGRIYPHYFIVMTPPLALLVGAGLQAILDRAPPAAPALVALAVLAITVPFAIANWRAALDIPAQQRWMRVRNPQLAPVDDAARLVRRITGPHDRVYVATSAGKGGQFLYWLADRRPADRLIFPGEMVPSRFREVGERLARRPPDVLVMVPGAPDPPFAAAIANGRLRTVARFPTASGEELRVLATGAAAARAG